MGCARSPGAWWRWRICSSDELWAAIVNFLARGSRSVGAPRAEQISHARQIVTTEPPGTTVGHRSARQERIGPPVASGEPAAGETTAPRKGSEGITGRRAGQFDSTAIMG